MKKYRMDSRQSALLAMSEVAAGIARQTHSTQELSTLAILMRLKRLHKK
jgi:hypothetical protein